MSLLPPLDVHLHAAWEKVDALQGPGLALAMALSLEEAQEALAHPQPAVAWGVGCDPCRAQAVATFEVQRFAQLLRQSPVVGECGLDYASPVPMARQVEVFRHILRIVQDMPRLVSIHSVGTAQWVLEELHRTPIAAPILHWWKGTAAQTSQAMALGCYFSVHPAIARDSKFRTRVAPERILIETDLGYGDPPAASACRVEWVEHLLGQQLKQTPQQVRALVWGNFARLAGGLDLQPLLPPAFAGAMRQAAQTGGLSPLQEYHNGSRVEGGNV